VLQHGQDITERERARHCSVLFLQKGMGRCRSKGMEQPIELKKAAHQILERCGRAHTIGQPETYNLSAQGSTVGLNRLLTELYKTDMRLSLLLDRLGFVSSQIEILRATHLEEVVDCYVGIIKTRIVGWEGGERLFVIICSRFGLDGHQPDTLAELGVCFGISRERVRQLETKTLRRCHRKWFREDCEKAMKEATLNMLNEVAPENGARDDTTSSPGDSRVGRLNVKPLATDRAS